MMKNNFRENGWTMKGVVKEGHPCEETQLLSDQLPSNSDQIVGFSLSKPLLQSHPFHLDSPNYFSFLTRIFFFFYYFFASFSLFNYKYTNVFFFRANEF